MTQRQAQRQTVIVNVAPKRKKRSTKRRAPVRPVRQHIMPPPVIQVVQERWFNPPPPQAPQQFHYQAPVLPKQEQNTSWESMTAPIQNPMGQVVGDLMQQGIEPTEMQGLSARDSLTSEKVAVDTQTEKTTNFPVSTQTWDAPKSTNTFGTQIGDDVGTELNTFKSTSTFGGQTEPPSRTTFASQTDAPGFNTVGTQLGRTPVKKPVPLLPPVPKIPFRGTTDAPGFATIDTQTEQKPYEQMSLEELKVAVQYKGMKGAQNFSKAQLIRILKSDFPSMTARLIANKARVRDVEVLPGSNITGSKRATGTRPTSSRIVSLD